RPHRAGRLPGARAAPPVLLARPVGDRPAEPAVACVHRQLASFARGEPGLLSAPAARARLDALACGGSLPLGPGRARSLGPHAAARTASVSRSCPTHLSTPGDLFARRGRSLRAAVDVSREPRAATRVS